MKARAMVTRIREFRCGTAIAQRCWLVLRVWQRKRAVVVLQRMVRVWSSNRQVKRMRTFVHAIVNLQGVCRGLKGRSVAHRRRVIREAVRFVVRTSILFGAARASAELMEVRECEGRTRKS
jgi:hypothetical protein